jgi:hypothetical protein
MKVWIVSVASTSIVKVVVSLPFVIENSSASSAPMVRPVASSNFAEAENGLPLVVEGHAGERVAARAAASAIRRQHGELVGAARQVGAVDEVRAVERRGVGDLVDLVAQSVEVGLQRGALVGRKVGRLSGDDFSFNCFRMSPTASPADRPTSITDVARSMPSMTAPSDATRAR